MGKYAGILALCACLGCDAADQRGLDGGSPSCIGAKCDDADGGEAGGEAGSPAQVQLGGEYTFCLDLAHADDTTRSEIDDAFVQMPLPNLHNVRLLAHVAAIAYWEPAELGPELARLGFGAPGDADLMAACGRDVALLRDSSADDPFADEGLSDCALDWLERGGSSAADFIEYAESSVHPERGIEFFSAGYETEAGTQYVRDSTQLVWAEHRDESLVVISFRGTEPTDLNDVWADANFPTVPFTFGRVHGGFDDALSSVRPLLDERLANLEPGTRIWVTGHSLGGALASVFGAELLARIDAGERLQFEGLVTFGSPRVGDDAFFAGAEAIAVEHGVAIHRVANVSRKLVGYDPIVHLPFRETFGEDFGHVGAPLSIFEDGTIEYALEPSRFVLPFGFVDEAIEKFKRAVAEQLSRAFPHFLTHYEKRIDAAIAGGRHEALMRCDPR